MARLKPRSRQTLLLAAMEGLEVRTLLSATAPGLQKGDGGQPVVVDLHISSEDHTAGVDRPSAGSGSDNNPKGKISPVENNSPGPPFSASSWRDNAVMVDAPGRQVVSGAAPSVSTPPGQFVMAMAAPPGHEEVSGDISPVHGKSGDISPVKGKSGDQPNLQTMVGTGVPAPQDEVPFVRQDHGPGESATSPPGPDGRGQSDLIQPLRPSTDVARGQVADDPGIAVLRMRHEGEGNSSGQIVDTRNEVASLSAGPGGNPSSVGEDGPKNNAPLISVVGVNSSSGVGTIPANPNGSGSAALSPQRDLADLLGRGMNARTESTSTARNGASSTSDTRGGTPASSGATPAEVRMEAATAAAAGQASPAGAATSGLPLAAVSGGLASIVSSVLAKGQFATAALGSGTAGRAPGRDVESDAGHVVTTDSHSRADASLVGIDIQAVLEGRLETFAASLWAGEGQASVGAMPAQAQGARDGGFMPYTTSASRPVRRPIRPIQAAPDPPEDAERLALGAVNTQLVGPAEGTGPGEDLSPVGPTISGVLSESLGMNTALIDRALQGLLEEIRGLDDSAARALGEETLPLWLAGAGLAVAATIYARRRVRRSRSAVLAGIRVPTSNWIAGLSFDAV